MLKSACGLGAHREPRERNTARPRRFCNKRQLRRRRRLRAVRRLLLRLERALSWRRSLHAGQHAALPAVSSRAGRCKNARARVSTGFRAREAGHERARSAHNRLGGGASSAQRSALQHRRAFLQRLQVRGRVLAGVQVREKVRKRVARQRLPPHSQQHVPGAPGRSTMLRADPPAACIAARPSPSSSALRKRRQGAHGEYKHARTTCALYRLQSRARFSSGARGGRV